MTNVDHVINFMKDKENFKWFDQKEMGTLAALKEECEKMETKFSKEYENLFGFFSEFSIFLFYNKNILHIVLAINENAMEISQENIENIEIETRKSISFFSTLHPINNIIGFGEITEIS